MTCPDLSDLFDPLENFLRSIKRTVGSCEGGALPVIMSITGPRETHNYLRNLCVPGIT